MAEGKVLTEAAITPLLPNTVVRRKDAPGSLDDITESGFYNAVKERYTDFPPGSYAYGILHVMKAWDFVQQNYYPHQMRDGYAFYTRMKYKEGWSSWKGVPGTMIPTTT